MVRGWAALWHEPHVALLCRCWRLLGEERARQLGEETLAIEANGGMLIADGSRRRTPGGVFFELVKRQASRKAFYRIFRTPAALS